MAKVQKQNSKQHKHKSKPLQKNTNIPKFKQKSKKHLRNQHHNDEDNNHDNNTDGQTSGQLINTHGVI